MLKITDNEFNRLVSFMRERYGINLSHKRTLIEGRLGNMLVERGFKNYDEYLDCCMNDRSGKELDGLLIKLTTNHTYFMREPEHFTYLTSTVLPFIKQATAKKQNNAYMECRLFKRRRSVHYGYAHKRISGQ